MNDFDKLIDDIEQEAVAEGPEAVAELRALDTRFRLAAELLAARTSAHMTQKELAVRSGVQQAEISKIERGEVVPKVSTMDRLLTPLGHRLAVVEDHDPVAASWPGSPRSADATSRRQKEVSQRRSQAEQKIDALRLL